MGRYSIDRSIAKLYSNNTIFFLRNFMSLSTVNQKLNKEAGFAQAFACFFYFSFFSPELGGR